MGYLFKHLAVRLWMALAIGSLVFLISIAAVLVGEVLLFRRRRG